MACLTSEGTTIEIRFKNFSVGWVDCEIRFLSHGQPILNENILGRHGCRENYAPSAIFANDHRECELLWVLKKNLIVKRHEIEKFYEELKAEYVEFKKQFKVDEHNFKEIENDWEPMEL